MAVYVIKCNALSGCLEPTKVSGNESLTLGCVWNSTDVAATINDCNGCQLAQLNQTSVAIGLNATALNNGTSVGIGATSTCTAVALGCVTNATDASIAIGSGSIACCNGIAINGTACDTDAIAIGTTAAADTVAIGNKVVVDTNAVIVGKSATGLSCSVSIGANATTAACAVAIGYCASVDCATGLAIGYCANAEEGVSVGRRASSCGSGVSIGCGATANTDAVAIGYGAYANGCSSIAIGSQTSVSDEGVIAIGYAVTPDSCCMGDTFIGLGANVFKFCSTTGYTYGNGCLMTGRILPSCSCLPDTNCSLLLYYVS